ncbi:MAG TPA: archease [Thermoanaerobaculaceae bacterium]|nr:archease [Thermoanaerobaculaceae bacterium]
MVRPRFRTLTHRADVRVAVWGEDEYDLIGNAVAAAIAAALGTRRQSEGRRRIPIVPWPPDLASRLVRAVNEALFTLYARREAACGVVRTPRGAALLVGPIPPGSAPELEIKAATYHDLRPRRRGGRLAALITLDV